MRLITLVIAMTIATLSVAAPLHGPHKHGSLGVAVVHDSDYLAFKIIITSQDLLGFEDSPQTDKKKEMVRQQYEKLYQEETLSNLFKFVPADACKPSRADMDSDMLDYHEHDDIKDAVSTDERDVHSVGDEDGHSDFLLNYMFKCSKVELVQITFHEVFPSIKQVDFYADGEVEGEPVVNFDAEDATIPGFN